nr:glycerate kinase [Conexibacter arvalis]
MCAPDKLRGALDAAEAAAALAAGARAAGAAAVELPIADGGEGTLDAFRDGATLHRVAVHDALGRPREGRIAKLDDVGTFLVEAAEAVPLHGLAEHERDVERASSRGVGELIAAALDRGARRLLVAVGGTATMDGGAGMLRALGGRCANDGAGLLADPSVDLSGVDPRLAQVELELLVDVAAPLTGPDGAARRFGPQKGATGAQVDALDTAHGRWAEALGIDPATPGAGAAGGLGAALQALGARTVAGADAVLDLKRFDALLAGCDLCLAAEGSVDPSTLQGKAVAAVVARCARAGVPVVVLGGRVEAEAAAELRRRGARDVRAIGPADRPLAAALAAAGEELEAAARAAVAEA